MVRHSNSADSREEPALTGHLWFSVTDSLDYSPEKCTIVAMYKQLVLGPHSSVLHRRPTSPT